MSFSFPQPDKVRGGHNRSCDSRNAVDGLICECCTHAAVCVQAGVRVDALTVTCVRELSRCVSLLGQVVQSPARAVRAAGKQMKHEVHCHHK